jgi:predicted DNA-binding transcriptional regulator AlpA
MPKRKPEPRRILTDADERFISTTELLERIPLHRTTLNVMVNEGRFPTPIKMTESKLVWRWSTILKWIEEREKHPAHRREFRNLEKRRPRIRISSGVS